MIIIAEAVDEIIRNINDTNKIRKSRETFLTFATGSRSPTSEVFDGTASRSYRSRIIDGRKIAQNIEADVRMMLRYL